MRQMEFKMERTGLLDVRQTLPVAEDTLPNSYFSTSGHATAMSAPRNSTDRLDSM